MYPFDSTGLATSNLVTGEEHAITSVSAGYNNYIVPKAAPFFRTTMTVVDKATGTILTEGTDYEVTDKFQEAIDNITLDIYGSVTLTDEARTGTIVLRYQTLGGGFVNAQTEAINNGLDTLANLNSRDWDFIADVPTTFPSTPHNHTVTEYDAVNELLDELILMRQAMESPIADIHLTDVIDLKDQFTTPLLTNLEQIANAINNQAAATRIPFEMATPGQTETSLGAVTDGEWKDTPLACTPTQVGTYKIDWDVNCRPEGASGAYTIETRFRVNNLTIDRSYSNHTAVGLTKDMTVQLQVRIVGSDATDLKIAGPDFSSSMMISRLGA